MHEGQKILAEAGTLLEAIRLGAGAAKPCWDTQELAEMLDHQLGAPLATELEHVVPDRGGLQALADDGPGATASFRDLLRQEDPPLGLLVSVKEYAKACIVREDESLPKPIYFALYYASILKAKLHHGKDISQLDARAIRSGIMWALDQPWLDKALRSLFTQGLKIIEA